MNQQDQDKMRDKHRATPDGYCIKCGVRAFNGELLPVEYPCDVTIVLNALELETYDMTGTQSSNENCVEMHEVRTNNVENVVSVDDEGNVVEPFKTAWDAYQWIHRKYTELGINTPKAEGCDHMIYDTEYGEFYPAKVWAYDYCPKCGEKL
jgi:hypothetical protein